MKRFKSLIISALAAGTLMFSFPQTARADLFGVGDAALLTQQIAQFLQDGWIDANGSTSGIVSILSQLKSKSSEVTRILNTLSTVGENAKGAYMTYQSVDNMIRSISNSTQQIQSMLQYTRSLMNKGGDFAYYATHCNNIYNSYLSRTNSIMSSFSDMSKALSQFKKGGASAYELNKMLQDLCDEAAAQINAADCEFYDETIQLYKTMNNKVEAINNASTMNAYFN